MSIAYSLLRPSRAARGVYRSTQRAIARELAARDALPTLTAAGVAAMTDPAGVTPVVDCALEIESNRLLRNTTVRLLRADSLAEVPLLDGAMRLGAIITGRANSTVRSAVADVTIADDVTGFDPYDPDDDELPVAFGDPIITRHTNPGATPRSASGVPAWTITTVGGATSNTGAATETQDITGDARMYTADLAAGSYVTAPAAAVAVEYRTATHGTRGFTVTAYLGLIEGAGRATAATVRLRCRHSLGVDTSRPIRLTATADTVAPRRHRFTFIRAMPAGVLTDPRVEILVETASLTVPAAAALTAPATLTATAAGTSPPATAPLTALSVLTATGAAAPVARLVWDAALVYPGDDRGPLVGMENAAPSPGAVVELTLDEPRRLNRVETHGDHRAGKITSASVEVRDPTHGTWRTAGGAGGTGRLAVLLPITEQTTGVRVRVEETDSGDDGRVWASEIDPQLVLDVSDRVRSCSISWDREADAGSSTIPVGNYQSADLTLDLENTQGDLDPGSSVAIDTGHRIELAVGVRYRDPDGAVTEEMLPAGVFYSEPWDAPSGSATVSLRATDRLGRFGGLPLDEEVQQRTSVGVLLRDAALRYLDLDDDQVRIAGSAGDYAIPFAYGQGGVGQFFADLAKSTLASVYVDPLERLVLTPRAASYSARAPVAEVRADNALITHRRPNVLESTVSTVKVTASPMRVGALQTLWELDVDGGIVLQPGGSWRFVADYNDAPAVNVAIAGITTTGPYTLERVRLGASRARFTIRNGESAITNTISTVQVRGTPLVAAELVAVRDHPPSVRRYGVREAAVEAPLLQTQEQLEGVADAILDTFRGIDDQGNRRLPEVQIDTLGLLHLDVEDVTTLADPRGHLSGDYVLTSRQLDYTESGALLMSARVRQAPTAVFAVTDQSLSDDTAVLGV